MSDSISGQREQDGSWAPGEMNGLTQDTDNVVIIV